MGNREKSIVLDKAFQFCLKVIRLCYNMKAEKEFVLSQQLLRSGTSIGANINEALGGYSTKDFQYKMSISLKEAQESEYWLRLLSESELFAYDFRQLIEDSKEIQRILTSIIKTTRSNIHK